MSKINHTTPFESRLVTDLHPILESAFNKAQKEWNESRNDVHVITVCTFRNNAMQEVYFKKRPKISNARAGQSPHNYYPALAFDIAFVKVGKRELDYNPKLFKQFWDIISKHSPKVEWGGNWKNFKDAPHYQLLNWKNTIV